MAKFELPPAADDGSFVPVVGEHSKDKHYFLSRYIHAFTTGMKNAIKLGKWKGLHYLDLFAGAGLERLRDSGKLSWGSPLIAAKSQPAFQGLHFCEESQKKYKALRSRLNSLGLAGPPQLLLGDANQKVTELVRTVPPRCLSMAFLDPYGLHVDYETIKVLATHRCDLIIFFPDRVDAARNWKLYLDDPNSNLDRFLGPKTNWRSIFKDQPPRVRLDRLRELYVKQIGALGYKHFEFERINHAKGGPIYQLIYCSKHELGAKYWRGVAKRKPDRQDTFDFGSPD